MFDIYIVFFVPGFFTTIKLSLRRTLQGSYRYAAKEPHLSSFSAKYHVPFSFSQGRGGEAG
jgi:hypothetical protein